jgi:eukaryotic-like serine/threonine-protein kinase
VSHPVQRRAGPGAPGKVFGVTLDPNVLTAGIRVGDVVAGKYRVSRLLGIGGMGVVLEATNTVLGSRVALKLLRREWLTRADSVARFLQEAQVIVRLQSEHVVRVHDLGHLDDGVPYIVMEWLQGVDLSRWLHGQGPLPVARATALLLQACVAVAEAHALHIVHRDLKPSNFFCAERSDGEITLKLLDFGLSKVEDGLGAAGSMTRTSAVLGSPRYMSPEQARSAKHVDARTDIWALGVMLFELLTQTLPFEGLLSDVVVKIATELPPSLCARRPDVPIELEAAVARCLQKEPERRFPNVGELALAIAPFAADDARSLAPRTVEILRRAGAGRATASACPAAPADPQAATVAAGAGSPAEATRPDRGPRT